jgi:hypothetical protein
MLTRTSRLLVFTAVAGFQLAFSGCAQNVGDLNRTQPHRIEVSVLNDGKPWWFLQTVVGIPPSSTFTFVGEASFPPDRIVWDVQENWLIAYRSYEWIVGSQTPYSATDHNTVIGGSNSPYFGTPVAAYAILSHFDVQREYNPQTGEQTNVVSENTTDHPWYQRQYIRVDWSNNAFGAFNFMALNGTDITTRSILTSPLAYYPDEEDPTNPDRAEVNSDYIGIVNKTSYSAQIDPFLTNFLGGAPVYTCFLWPQAFGIADCGPGEVKIRLSFRKVPADHDFVPRVYTDKDVLKFGVWTQQHQVWDPERGFLEANFAQNSNAVMHHIWTKDHLATDSVTGNACNPNDSANVNCVAPLNMRTPKPIVYYTSDTWPAIDDTRHSKMWVHQKLLAEDYNDDMRGVVAAALRGGPNSVENWMSTSGIPDPAASVKNINYSVTNPQDYANRYKGIKGLDYLAYPPDLRHLDTANFGLEGVRPNQTYITSDGSSLCTASQVASGACTPCDPKAGYCMGIGHVPYSVIPRMFVMCHNPVQPRVAMYGGTTYNKTDSTDPNSFDFSTPGDPDVCDPRSDQARTANPLSPRMGDLRYHMLAWVNEPDQASPGGIGEPAFDPVTGEIVTSHGYIYARAIELNATASADLVAVMNGWETYNDFISGNMVRDYVNAQQGKPLPQFSANRLEQMMTAPTAVARMDRIRQQIAWGQRDPNGADWGRTNWQQMQNMLVPSMNLNWQAPPPSPGNGEWTNAFAPAYGPNANGLGLPQAVQQQISMASFLAPLATTTWNSQYTTADRILTDRHVLTEDEIAPVAMRLAKYYKDKFAKNDPCKGTYSDTSGGDYKTCIWETARQEIVGNMWRSYSDHEVGHTFGQYHNFAGSTDALNYFDPYWALRQQNTMQVDSPANPNCFVNKPDPLNPSKAYSSNCGSMYMALGPVPGNAALAPEWLQAPTQQSLDQGLREYQYTSIMDYNANFNADFQGLGKYDHACHMYQYANTVEVFDHNVLSKVPQSTAKETTSGPTYGQQLYPHETSDELRVPFNVHYTMYPWIINDGLTTNHSNATPLPLAIEKMIHARRWVNYNDLIGTAQNPNDTAAVDTRSGMSASDLQASIQVPYRFCSDVYNQGESQCLWFDSGADQFEQANGFIQDYNTQFMFRNFKRGIFNVNIADDYWHGGYQTRLWQRTFQPLVRISQHWVNEELLVRGSTMCPLDQRQIQHLASVPCGLAGTAAAVTIEDFFTKILQVPNTETYTWDNKNNIYCGSGGGNCSAANVGGTLQSTPLTFLPGESSKFDLSQYNQQQYGQFFLVKPTVVGYWEDKVMAAVAMGDYYTYFVGSLNNQPLSYLISMNDLFFKDTQRALGAWILDDPKVAPLVAAYTANPQDSAHPPVSVYVDSHALASSADTGYVGQINHWCPSNAAWCAETQGVTPVDPPLGYSLLTYQAPNGTTQPARIDPSAVYFEKLLGLGVAIVYYTNNTDDQKWIQSIRVNKIGDATGAAPAPLGCRRTNGSASNNVPTPSANPSCADGSPCGAVDLTGSNCADGSFCIRRNYTCPGSEVPHGTCLATNGVVTSFDPNTCDPNMFAYFSDGQNVYWAQKYVPQFTDLTDQSVDPSTYYSPNYEAVKLAATQQGSGSTTLSARQFLDLFRAYYFWFQYGTEPDPTNGGYTPWPSPN